jgi:hypothetical protein
VYNSPYEDELAAIKKAKRLKTDTETKVYVAEMAHLLNAPAVWLSPDLRTLERFTRSNTASFDRYLPTLRKKLPAHYRRTLPAAAKAEREYQQLTKKKKDYVHNIWVLDKQMNREAKIIKKYRNAKIESMVKRSTNRSRGTMTFRNLTTMTLNMYQTIDHTNSSYKRTYTFTLPPKGSRTLKNLKIGNKYGYNSPYGIKDKNGYTKLSNRRRALIKRRDQNLAQLKANTYYQDLNYSSNLIKTVFSGGKKQSSKVAEETVFFEQDYKSPAGGLRGSSLEEKPFGFHGQGQLLDC